MSVSTHKAISNDDSCQLEHLINHYYCSMAKMPLPVASNRLQGHAGRTLTYQAVHRELLTRKQQVSNETGPNRETTSKHKQLEYCENLCFLKIRFYQCNLYGDTFSYKLLPFLIKLPYCDNSVSLYTRIWQI